MSEDPLYFVRMYKSYYMPKEQIAAEREKQECKEIFGQMTNIMAVAFRSGNLSASWVQYSDSERWSEKAVKCAVAEVNNYKHIDAKLGEWKRSPIDGTTERRVDLVFRAKDFPKTGYDDRSSD